MQPPQHLARLLASLGVEARACRVVGDRLLVCRVDRHKLASIALSLHDNDVCRFTTCLAYDHRPIDSYYHVVYVFDCNRYGWYIGLEVLAPGAYPHLPSLAAVLDDPACTWCEWEIRDLYGITFDGHPGKGRLVLPDTWPEELPPPMRKDATVARVDPVEALERSRKAVAGEAVRPLLPVGPYHPALHEPELFELVVEGERIVEARYRGFFVYRGIEKLAEDRFKLEQVPFLAERICGICGYVHSCTYCRAVEAALGVEVPERAKYVRTLLLELERIHSHMLWMAVVLHTVGFEPGFMHLMALREAVMDAAEVLTGNRKTYGVNLPGGVRRDLDASKLQAVMEKVGDAVEKAVKLARSYLEVSEVRSRLEGVGVLTRSDARRFSALGPTARASGLEVDVRRDHPYEAYGELEFGVVVRDEGDCLARFLVRLEELVESLKIMRQAAKQIPPGELRAEITYGELREGFASSEAPRGEVVHYVVTGRGGRVWRWKVRAPSYNNIALLPHILEGCRLADAPVVIASIDPCFSCTDRVVVVTDRGRYVTSLYKLSRGWRP